MIFSHLDVIGKERTLRKEQKEIQNEKFLFRMVHRIFNQRNPIHTFIFYVPEYLYLRSCSFCSDIEREIDDTFTIGELADILYFDFLEYVRKTNDINTVYKRLAARDLAPARIFQTEDVYNGVIYEEIRGYEMIETRIDHKDALKGEFLLRDMLEIYTDHKFKLENILEIVFCDFIDDYRRGLIKNPLSKILHYIDY
ncbi:hypothetical protein P9265_14655 [Schinkia azotoformans]|uniref:hypothetical protein n=1 Tax=Schinkia azotoformans TaxID=1454 RepID=UPI002E2185F7|nr:hypothetical protein [Schinkia azotoformans]